MRRAASALRLVVVSTVLVACAAEPTPTPGLVASPPPTPTPLASATLSPRLTPRPTASDRRSPAPTPEPPLSLPLPESTDARAVSVSVEPQVGADGGQILVSVTSLADDRIDELVLRWPAELRETLLLAPFVPSPERIREGGAPLVQAWTKWVLGPGEKGEPEGTISLGYGPLLAGATLTIPLHVRRVAEGPVGFDLQVLAGNELLALEGGEPAELRVEVP